jgi:WD40 repeat protein
MPYLPGFENDIFISYSHTFSPDGKTLATASDDDTVKLWDVASRQNVTTLKDHEAYVTSVAFSPDGKTLASGSGDKRVKLWNVASRK